ncbi:uncharacterized protein Pyn_00409 [Prunus yedoensis var. nudiflora]|uniref:Uncharacterized protein n=1 Tax=Prunus yedoensis var. nudiflora TaxID=2094558 RepID=A0A314UQG9_PRUYE|nr:uncharacterized protein Pyn_00409 [Prunus yedoensis var. nudiflora]
MAPSKPKPKTKTKTKSISTSPVSLKLLIDKKHNKLLFAKAGKDFVDFRFTFLSLPVGTMIRLLSKKRMDGCLGKLYDSLENLYDIYLQPNLNKDFLLKLKNNKVPIGGAHQILPALTDGGSNGKALYTCRSFTPAVKLLLLLLRRRP